MRLWTIQPRAVWQQIEADGFADVDPLTDPGWYADSTPPEYLWLVRQLKSRIAGYCGRLPWWCYCEKPDLRLYRHTRPAGSREVRLELEIDDASAAAFPGWAWNEVYCQHYVALTKREEQNWKRRLRRHVPDEDTWPLPQPWLGELERSWLRIFDPRLPARRRRWTGRIAVIERLNRDDIRRVTHFVGTNTKWDSLDLEAGTSLPTLRSLAERLGWMDLMPHHRRVYHSGTTTWYEAREDDDCWLQFNQHPAGQSEFFAGAVYAMRHGIHTGWHRFELPSNPMAIKRTAKKLDQWLARRWFASETGRRAFLAAHPECGHWELGDDWPHWPTA